MHHRIELLDNAVHVETKVNGKSDDTPSFNVESEPQVLLTAICMHMYACVLITLGS